MTELRNQKNQNKRKTLLFLGEYLTLSMQNHLT